MVSHKSAIIGIFAAIMISSPVTFGLVFQAHDAQAYIPRGVVARAPLAVSGPNIYTAWNNNSATIHGVAIFFTKSNDGGKTFANTMVLSPPNTNPKISVIRGNISIGASGSNVAVTWWTNESGALNPVIRTSSDGGNTFGNLMMLNSTSGGVNK
jgi:hypothetical protein